MNKDELAAVYYTATKRMHDTVTALYENCHTEEGHVCESIDQINKSISYAKMSMDIEYDLIQTALQEYKEK
jgi:hypothetical protein|tara:strand:- start:279 stop:491 length:213 start_codon:yes stop_codon:yes gene_type:complete